MKIDRLIGILAVLLQQEQVTAPQMAALFEVSRRTIVRDIDTLSQAGIPIVTTQGMHGGIRIMDGYRVDRTVLTNADMLAILAGLRSLDSVSGTHQYAQLMEKLAAGSSSVLPADQHILINLAAWDKTAVSRKIETIHHAIERKRIIEFYYVSPSGSGKRTVEPYYLIFEWSWWYVWGWCASRNDFRLFKLSRITDLAVGDPFYGHPVPYPDLSTEKVFPSRYQVRAIVQQQYRWRLLEDFGADSFVEQPDGTLRFSFGFTDVESIKGWVLSYGDGMELLEPNEVREDLGQFGQRLAQRYGEHDR